MFGQEGDFFDGRLRLTTVVCETVALSEHDAERQLSFARKYTHSCEKVGHHRAVERANQWRD